MFGRSASRADRILITILATEAALIWWLARWEHKHNH